MKKTLNTALMVGVALSTTAVPALAASDPHAGHHLPEASAATSDVSPLHLADEHNYGRFAVDRLERLKSDDSYATAFEMNAYWGRDYDRAVLKLSGELADQQLEEGSTELLWQHALTAFWNSQVGVRHDSGSEPDQTWLAAGVSGLAPYWLELDAFAYWGEGGQTEFKLEGEYELLLTQRLVLQPSVELVAYGQDDRLRHRGDGLAEVTAGARLRYEIRRNFAPYVGVERVRYLGETADILEGHGEVTGDTRWLAGLRFWF